MTRTKLLFLNDIGFILTKSFLYNLTVLADNSYYAVGIYFLCLTVNPGNKGLAAEFMYNLIFSDAVLQLPAARMTVEISVIFNFPPFSF